MTIDSVSDDHKTVLEAMADQFVAEGVDAIFTLMGDGNMHFIPRLVSRGVRVYCGRHENMCLAMADGYHRRTGNVGVASVTFGPGVTQLGTGLRVAQRRGAPIVVMAGDTWGRETGNQIQATDQQQFVEGAGAVFHRVESAATAAQETRAAFHRARTLPGPVVLSVPIGIQQTPVSADCGFEAPQPPSSPEIPDPFQITLAAQALIDASRPIVLLGRGGMEGGVAPDAEALADDIGALLANTLPAFGAFSGHPYDLGIAGGYATAAAAELFREADVLLAIGVSFTHFTTDGGRLFPDARVISVNRADVTAQDHKRRYPDRGFCRPEMTLLGAARATVALLHDEIRRLRPARGGFRTPEVAQMLAADHRLAALAAEEQPALEPNTVDPRRLVIEIDRLLPDDCLIVCGVGHFAHFVPAFLTAKRSRQLIFTSDFGAVGQAIATAVGAALSGTAKHVIAFEGDTSAMMAIQELDTATRYNARLLLVVMNDQALGAEMHRLVADPIAYELSQIPTPSFAALARAFGATGTTVSRPGAARGAVRRYLQGEGTHVIDARISRAVVYGPQREGRLG